jgi:outer membrane protein OmpA-like peptidoglycan-associated protein
MVTAAEMSDILGATVATDGENGGGSTSCRYKPAERSTPNVELTVDWGGGHAAMTGVAILGKREPGISDPLAGLGDEASSIGPALWVRVGDDLVNLTIWGVDEDVVVAKRIIELMRPRMGASAQAKAPDQHATDEAAKAGAIVSSLLDRLSKETARSGDAHEDHEGTGPPARGSTPVDEPSYGPATGLPIRIPLVAGLTLVGAEHEPGRGDYEPIVTITGVMEDKVSTAFSATLPEGGRVQIHRAVRRDDLRQARAYLSWYEEGDPLIFNGATSFSVSTAVLTDLKTRGQADVVRLGSRGNSLVALAQRLTGGDTTPARHAGTLHRIEPHAVAFPVLLNDMPVQLPAIHARGTFDDANIDFYVLDDPDNPLLLRLVGTAAGRIVRIAFPSATAPIEDTLKSKARVELHGIYFDVGKATIRPESEPVLRDIATALAHNPSWQISIEGHTDNIGGDALNLDLSRRRADAVKQALVNRYRVQAANMTTAGFGASRPAAPNDTLAGRARNRRVELVRQ